MHSARQKEAAVSLREKSSGNTGNPVNKVQDAESQVISFFGGKRQRLLGFQFFNGTR